MDKINGSVELLNSLDIAYDMEATETLDKKSKELLRNKEVLAVILKGVVSEYEDYTYKQIMDFIENDSITSEEVTVGRSSTRITGEDKEFAILGEKTSIFDTKFRSWNPNLSTASLAVHLHIDLEPQGTYRPGYPIEKRGLYYLARELSSQLSLVTDQTDYNALEKCYSIWICRDDVPKDERFSISLFEIQNTHNCGECHPSKENYDLLSLVLIRLGDSVYNGVKTDEGYDVLHFLHTIMYPAKEDFLKSVKQHIDFSHNKELWKEVKQMSGLGMCILKDGVEQGLEQGREEGIRNLISAYLDDGANEAFIINKLVKKYMLTEQEATQYFERFTSNDI